jgi:hypothetical protein
VNATGEIVMKIERDVIRAIAAASVALPLLAQSFEHVSAQSQNEARVTGSLVTASFRTAQGQIHVHFPADAAPSDTISGVVLTEPAGATPQEQQSNARTLAGLAVDLEGQTMPVSAQRYEWTLAEKLRGGRATLTLHGMDGRPLSRIAVPIEAQAPLPPGPGAPDPVLPAEVQISRPAAIRGRFDGTLRNKRVEVGGGTADLLAASPRQVVFRVTQATFGEVPIRFTSNDRLALGVIRAIGVRLSTPVEQLQRDQRATLTTTVTGLGGIKAPATLAFRNLTPGVVRIEGGEARVRIEPRDVKADGTFTDTRQMTGVQAGAFQIVASVSRPAFSRFDVAATIERVVNAWEARARFRIAPDARTLIQRSVLEARRRVEDFLAQQEMRGADPQALFQSLLAHYCYDLRDNQLSADRQAGAPMPRQGVLLAALQQPAPSNEVAPTEVRRWSFSQFLSDLVARASSQSIGYLFVTSSPERAPITIDGQRKSEVTNRRFVTSVGNHIVQVARASKPCRVDIYISELQTSVVNCE